MRHRATQVPVVLVVAAIANASHRQMVSGVIEYCDRHARWDTLFDQSESDYRHFLVQVQMADAIIAAPTRPEHISLARAANRPVVLMGFGAEDMPSVQPDEIAIGELACKGFLDQGVRSLAFCGMPAIPFSQLRGKGFVQAAARAGVKVREYERPVYPQIHSDPHELEPFHRFLGSLPAPTGLFVATSQLATTVLHHCRLLRIDIPDRLLVLAVDDDEILCNVTNPRLSAIDQAPDRMGYEAAAMLDRILAGQPLSRRELLVPPRGIVARKSTDMVNTDNPYVAQAIRYIRSRVEDGISVNDVLRAIPTSRRALERGFRHNVGRTIHDEIIRSRVDRARYLIDQTRMTLPEIAARSGFSYPSKLSSVFKRVTGQSPSEYRSREGAS